MSRLQQEIERLFLVAPPAAPADAAGTPAAARALVLALGQPADWAPLAQVWSDVQDVLGLPAPAIAIAGDDAMQLWFSLAEPVGVAEGAAFLEGLRERWLAELPRHRVACAVYTGFTGEGDAPSRTAADEANRRLDAPRLPPRETRAGRWSAFVAPDLAPLFVEGPWLEMPPSDDGQATLLASLRSTPRAVFRAALSQFGTADAGAVPRKGEARELRAVDTPQQALAPRVGSSAPPLGLDGEPAARVTLEPRAFLARVMADETAPLALRVEAAKALLAHGPGPRP